MNITYLLGAGASANEIPVVNGFIPALKTFKNELSQNLTIDDDYFDNSTQQTTLTVSQAKEKLISDYEWLISEAKKFSTIDTFARKLYITGEIENYSKLKFLLSYFLSAIQSPHKNDKRYDNLFAALIGIKERKAYLPGNFSIISWNYDLQTEISISKFLNKKLNSNFLESVQNTSILQNISENKFNLIKLNGTAGFYEENYLRTFDFDISDFLASQKNTKTELNKYLRRSRQTDGTLLSFSWDKEPFIDNGRKIAANILKQSQFLVIIGYSFPVFNREIDKELLLQFNKKGKIFIQDKENSKKIMETVAEMSNLQESNIKIIESIDEFYIPLSYSPEY